MVLITKTHLLVCLCVPDNVRNGWTYFDDWQIANVTMNNLSLFLKMFLFRFQDEDGRRTGLRGLDRRHGKNTRASASESIKLLVNS